MNAGHLLLFNWRVFLVRPPGTVKKQVKRSLANKSKTMADIDSNSDGKMRPVLTNSKANCEPVTPEGVC